LSSGDEQEEGSCKVYSFDAETSWFLLHHDQAMLSHSPVLSRAPRLPAGNRIMQWNLPEAEKERERMQQSQSINTTRAVCRARLQKTAKSQEIRVTLAWDDQEEAWRRRENQFARSISGWSGPARTTRGAASRATTTPSTSSPARPLLRLALERFAAGSPLLRQRWALLRRLHLVIE
jgi:hypothetical protein